MTLTIIEGSLKISIAMINDRPNSSGFDSGAVVTEWLQQ